MNLNELPIAPMSMLTPAMEPIETDDGWFLFRHVASGLYFAWRYRHANHRDIAMSTVQEQHENLEQHEMVKDLLANFRNNALSTTPAKNNR